MEFNVSNVGGCFKGKIRALYTLNHTLILYSQGNSLRSLFTMRLTFLPSQQKNGQALSTLRYSLEIQ